MPLKEAILSHRCEQAVLGIADDGTL